MYKSLYKRYITTVRADRKSSFKPSIGKTQLMRAYKKKTKNLINKDLSD